MINVTELAEKIFGTLKGFNCHLKLFDNNGNEILSPTPDFAARSTCVNPNCLRISLTYDDNVLLIFLLFYTLSGNIIYGIILYYTLSGANVRLKNENTPEKV